MLDLFGAWGEYRGLGQLTDQDLIEEYLHGPIPGPSQKEPAVKLSIIRKTAVVCSSTLRPGIFSSQDNFFISASLQLHNCRDSNTRQDCLGRWALELVLEMYTLQFQWFTRLGCEGSNSDNNPLNSGYYMLSRNWEIKFRRSLKSLCTLYGRYNPRARIRF